MARMHRRAIQRSLHDPYNHDREVTLLEPDILECEVKWALGGITTNIASGGDGIPSELFQIPKDDAVKFKIGEGVGQGCTQYASKFGKLSSGHRDWEKPVFIPIPKKGNVKECSNYHTVEFISRTSKIMLQIF